MRVAGNVLAAKKSGPAVLSTPWPRTRLLRSRIMNTSTINLTAWQRAWRDGIVPQLTIAGLQGLKAALERDDPCLITGATTFPPPLQCVTDWPVERCCPLCYALLDGKQPHEVSVGLLEDRFAAACYRADQLLGEPAAVRYFLNQVDGWSREELRQNLLPEIKLALAQREPKFAA